MEALHELALFAGAGGGILGGHLLGWRCVCAVEIEDYARACLLSRQRDGLLPLFPVWDDVRTFDGRPWRGQVDIVTGGFPCQDISVAGKGAGLDGARSGLWAEMARIIGEVRPRFALVENSPALTIRGLGRVLGDLASLGYGARYGVFSARMAGAPHLRERLWILAHPEGQRWSASIDDSGTPRAHKRDVVGGDRTQAVGNSDSPRQLQPRGRVTKQRRRPRYTGARGWWSADPADVADADQARSQERMEHARPDSESGRGEHEAKAGRTESLVGRVAYGVACRVDRLKALGNGQVPAVVALAWRSLGGPALAAEKG